MSSHGKERRGEGLREDMFSGSVLIRRLVMLYQGPTLTTSSLSPGMVTFRDEGFDYRILGDTVQSKE